MVVKLQGQLVGGPIQTLLTGGVGLVSNHYKNGRDQVLWRDLVTLAGNVIGDQISLGLFPASTVFDMWRSRITFDALGAGATLNIGDATFPTGLASARSVAAAGLTRPFWPVSGLLWSQTLLWQRLGYGADPGGPIELLATFAGANPANGKFGWCLVGQK